MQQLFKNMLFMTLFGAFCTINNAHALYVPDGTMSLQLCIQGGILDGSSSYSAVDCNGVTYSFQSVWTDVGTCLELIDVPVDTSIAIQANEYPLFEYCTRSAGTEGWNGRVEFYWPTYDEMFDSGVSPDITGGLCSCGSGGGSSGGGSSSGGGTEAGRVIDLRNSECGYFTTDGDDWYPYLAPGYCSDVQEPYYFCASQNAVLWNNEPSETLNGGDIVILNDYDIYYCCGAGNFVRFDKADYDEDTQTITYNSCGYIGMKNLGNGKACEITGEWDICGGEKSVLPEEAGTCVENTCTKMTHCTTGYYKDIINNTCKQCTTDTLPGVKNLTCNKSPTTVGYTSNGVSACYIPSGATCTDDTGTLTLNGKCYY